VIWVGVHAPTAQIQDLEKNIKEMAAKCIEVEKECGLIEAEVAQLKERLTTSYRHKITSNTGDLPEQ
jgi:peptidoglycan hydrolase CwlO-like protein